MLEVVHLTALSLSSQSPYHIVCNLSFRHTAYHRHHDDERKMLAPDRRLSITVAGQIFTSVGCVALCGDGPSQLLLVYWYN